MSSPSQSLARSPTLVDAFAAACRAAGPIRLRATHRRTGAESSHVVNGPFAFVGRAEGVGVRLDDPSVSQCHAYLQVVEGVLCCIDLGSRTGVVWDDGRQGHGWVHPGQTLRIGAFDVRSEGPPAAHPAAAEDASSPDLPALSALAPAEVELLPANAAGNVFPLERPITLVGRHPSCDLRLFDTSVAYFQCALVNTPDGIWFVDIMSRLGGVLNGRATRLAQVKHGDLLELGRASLLVRVGGHVGNGTFVRNPAAPPAPIDPVAAVSATLAQSVAGAFLPVGEMVKQFQECFVNMTQMFAAMQREHAALVQEQLRQIRDLAAEVRELRDGSRRADGPTPVTPPAAPTVGRPDPVPVPTPPRPATGAPHTAAGQPLADAHAWFMDRLANKEPTPPAGS